MTPVNLGDLPSTQSIPTGVAQLIRGAWDGEGNIPGDNVQFTTPYSPMEIAITTGSRPGWWIVRAEGIFRVLDAAWYYFAWRIDLSPADTNGYSQESCHGRMHSAISWQHYAVDGVFRLNPNTTYVAKMVMGYRQAGTFYAYYGPNYLYLGGEFVAEGSL